MKVSNTWFKKENFFQKFENFTFAIRASITLTPWLWSASEDTINYRIMF
jgi:hypothetical protein